METTDVKKMDVNGIKYILYKDAWIDPATPINKLNDKTYILGGIKIRYYNPKKTRRIIYRELKSLFKLIIVFSLIFGLLYLIRRYL